MKFERIKNYRDEEFRRLIGVKWDTFEKMITILKQAEAKKKAGGVTFHFQDAKL